MESYTEKLTNAVCDQVNEYMHKNILYMNKELYCSIVLLLVKRLESEDRTELNDNDKRLIRSFT